MESDRLLGQSLNVFHRSTSDTDIWDIGWIGGIAGAGALDNQGAAHNRFLSSFGASNASTSVQFEGTVPASVTFEVGDRASLQSSDITARIPQIVTDKLGSSHSDGGLSGDERGGA